MDETLSVSEIDEEADTLDDVVALLDAVADQDADALPLPLGETGEGEALRDGDVLAPNETLGEDEGDKDDDND